MNFAALALGPAFATFGSDAAYTAPEGGPPVPCRVVFRSNPAVDGLGDMQVRRVGRQLQVRKTEIVRPKERGLFTIGAEAWRVTGAPWCDDPLQLVWTMVVVPS